MAKRLMTSIRMRKDVRARLDQMCKKFQRSRSEVMERLVGDWFTAQKKHGKKVR